MCKAVLATVVNRRATLCCDKSGRICDPFSQKGSLVAAWGRYELQAKKWGTVTVSFHLTALLQLTRTFPSFKLWLILYACFFSDWFSDRVYFFVVALCVCFIFVYISYPMILYAFFFLFCLVFSWGLLIFLLFVLVLFCFHLILALGRYV